MTNINLPIDNKLLGEVGDVLPKKTIVLIRALAEVGYWPIAFGENDGKMTELMLAYDPSVSDRQAEHFISQNGVD